MDHSERIGLGVSTGGHVLLLAALSFGLLHWGTPKVLAPPAIEVAIADHIALESRAASHAAPQQAQAPELGPVPPDVAQLPPKPAVQPAPVPSPEPILAPDLKKTAKAEAEKARTTDSKASATRDKNSAQAALDKALIGKGQPPRAPRLGSDFLRGLDTPGPKSKTPTAPGGGAAPLDATTARALNAEINRQIKPFWKAPSGADADKLVTIVTVNLATDGSIIGQPRVVRQTGVTPSNEGQKQLHAENAIRAIKLAAPFKLPPDLYDAWQSLEISFDKRLSQ